MDIAFLGTGLLGYPMARRLLEQGHHLNVYNRTPQKASGLAEHGAGLFFSPAEAVRKSDCVITVLSDRRANDEVLFADSKLSYKDKTVIQMGTIAPEESVELQKKIYKRGGEYIECPVLGSRREAAAGTLILMVGATPEKFANWQSFLKSFGPDPRYVGGVGKAAALKLALNHLIAAHAVSFPLSLGLVEKSGIDTALFMGILKESALFAPMFERKLPKWLARDYAGANFPAKHLLKDVELVLQEARKHNLAPDHLQALQGLLRKTVEKGMGEQDYSAVLEIINPVSP